MEAPPVPAAPRSLGSWGAWILRGVVAILFGLAALVFPGLTLTGLVYLFGAYVLLDGLLALAAMVGHRGGRRPWWSLLLEGVVGLAIGVLTFASPGVTMLALLYLIAGWSFATGLFEIAAAVRMRRELRGEVALIVAGILSLVFGVLLAIVPVAGLLAVAWLVGVYAILFGLSLLTLGFRLRRRPPLPEPGTTRRPRLATSRPVTT